MMGIKTAILVIVLSLLLLGTASAAQSKQVPCYSGVPETLSGAGYQLTSLPLEPEGVVVSGGRYQLLVPATSTLRGNGCCCVFLPSVYAQ
jgi:hypothetical protein